MAAPWHTIFFLAGAFAAGLALTPGDASQQYRDAMALSHSARARFWSGVIRWHNAQGAQSAQGAPTDAELQRLQEEADRAAEDALLKWHAWTRSLPAGGAQWTHAVRMQISENGTATPRG